MVILPSPSAHFITPAPLPRAKKSFELHINKVVHFSYISFSLSVSLFCFFRFWFFVLRVENHQKIHFAVLRWSHRNARTHARWCCLFQIACVWLVGKLRLSLLGWTIMARLSDICLLFSGFSNVCHSACFWPTFLKLGCITNYDTLILMMGFISSGDEI